FSSRRRHTISKRDWSSDVCSSDLFLKEHVRRFQAIAIVIAFAGTFFIIKPAFDLEVVPYILGFLSAVFAAGAYTVLRVLGDKEQFYTVVFYFSFFTTV